MSNAGKELCPRNYTGQLFRLIVPTQAKQTNKKKHNKKSTTEAEDAKQDY